MLIYCLHSILDLLGINDYNLWAEIDDNQTQSVHIIFVQLGLGKTPSGENPLKFVCSFIA